MMLLAFILFSYTTMVTCQNIPAAGAMVDNRPPSFEQVNRTSLNDLWDRYFQNWLHGKLPTIQYRSMIYEQGRQRMLCLTLKDDIQHSTLSINLTFQKDGTKRSETFPHRGRRRFCSGLSVDDV